MNQETMQATLAVIGLCVLIYAVIRLIAAIVEVCVNWREIAKVEDKLRRLRTLQGKARALEFIRTLNYGWSDKAMVSYFNKAAKEDPKMLGVIRSLCLNYYEQRNRTLREESMSLRKELDAAFEQDI